MELIFNMLILIINWVIGEGSVVFKIKSDLYLNYLVIFIVFYVRLDLWGYWYALGLCSIRCKFLVINIRYVLFYL